MSTQKICLECGNVVDINSGLGICTYCIIGESKKEKIKLLILKDILITPIFERKWINDEYLTIDITDQEAKLRIKEELMKYIEDMETVGDEENVPVIKFLKHFLNITKDKE